MSGHTFDLANDDATTNGVSGARVIALDANRAPISAVAVSDRTGKYQLQIPWSRQADGTLGTGQITLRADAEFYQTFPSGLRVAVPIDVASATKGTSDWALQNAQTDIGLIELPSTTNLAKIHGTVAAPPGHVGVLVVAEPAGGGGVTGVADKSGKYAIFNLPVSGTTTYSVKAYASGANYTTVSQALVAGDDATVDLALKDTVTATVTGNVQFTGQNLPDVRATSVILAVKSTFIETLGSGESPPGLRATNVTSTYSITGVPDGEYFVLAAFENDGMVRDVSGIGGTAPVLGVIQNGTVTTAPTSFKITGALTFTEPFVAPYDVSPWPATSTTPTFNWSSYSSTDHYAVSVVDTFGNLALAPTDVTKDITSFTYPSSGATALTPGMYYQFKVAVIGKVSGSFAPISQSEDLKGVFFIP